MCFFAKSARMKDTSFPEEEMPFTPASISEIPATEDGSIFCDAKYSNTAMA